MRPPDSVWLKLNDEGTIIAAAATRDELEPDLDGTDVLVGPYTLDAPGLVESVLPDPAQPESDEP